MKSMTENRAVSKLKIDSDSLSQCYLFAHISSHKRSLEIYLQFCWLLPLTENEKHTFCKNVRGEEEAREQNFHYYLSYENYIVCVATSSVFNLRTTPFESCTKLAQTPSIWKGAFVWLCLSAIFRMDTHIVCAMLEKGFYFNTIHA